MPRDTHVSYLHVKHSGVANLVLCSVARWYEYLDPGLPARSSVQSDLGHHDVGHGGVVHQGLQLSVGLKGHHQGAVVQ